MEALWVIPPVAFGVYLVVVGAILRSTSRFSSRPGGPKGKTAPYACGEDFPSERLTPDYGQFFPFAIFFTLIHVAGLMLATLCVAPAAATLMGAAYVLSVGAVLAILFAR
jgi:NADH:ubiquinone oxidoreductase subunit 3 (subunit A)